MTAYARKCGENAAMSFRANNKQLLKNYSEIWEKVEKLMRIDFESKKCEIQKNKSKNICRQYDYKFS